MRCRTRAFLLLFLAGPLQAQSMRERLRDVFHFGTCDTLVCLDVGILTAGHGAHFNPDAAITLTSLIDLLSAGISTSVSNIPLGGTSSGTTVTFDQSGAPIATSGTTGSIFGERAQTLGRGRALFGVNVTGAKFNKVRGINLSNINSTLTHQDVNADNEIGNPDYEVDTIHVRTNLNTSFTAATAFLTYGISNRLDIGVAVPLVRFSFSGQSIGEIFNVTGGQLHRFGIDPSTGAAKLVDTASSSGSSTGIGDVSIRLKLNLGQTQRAGAAFLADVRLPTGKSEDLLGTGNVSARGLAVVSGRYGSISPHLNAGYLYRSGSDETSAMLATVGFDALIAPRVTLAADFLGQWQAGGNKLPVPPPVTFIDGSVVKRTTIPDQKDNVLGASVGAKFLLPGDFIAVANTIIPLSDGILRSSVIWTVGLEKNF